MNLIPECKVEFLRVGHNAKLPVKVHGEGDAAYDLYYDGPRIYLGPVNTTYNFLTFSTGWKISLPPHWEGQVRSRSGLASKRGVMVINSPGTIDPDFSGELKVCLVNLSNEGYIVEPGDRIAQIRFAKVPVVELVEVTEFSRNVARKEASFGSTGR